MLLASSTLLVLAFPFAFSFPTAGGEEGRPSLFGRLTIDTADSPTPTRPNSPPPPPDPNPDSEMVLTTMNHKYRIQEYDRIANVKSLHFSFSWIMNQQYLESTSDMPASALVQSFGAIAPRASEVEHIRISLGHYSELVPSDLTSLLIGAPFSKLKSFTVSRPGEGEIRYIAYKREGEDLYGLLDLDIATLLTAAPNLESLYLAGTRLASQRLGTSFSTYPHLRSLRLTAFKEWPRIGLGLLRSLPGLTELSLGEENIMNEEEFMSLPLGMTKLCLGPLPATVGDKEGDIIILDSTKLTSLQHLEEFRSGEYHSFSIGAVSSLPGLKHFQLAIGDLIELESLHRHISAGRFPVLETLYVQLIRPLNSEHPRDGFSRLRSDEEDHFRTGNGFDEYSYRNDRTLIKARDDLPGRDESETPTKDLETLCTNLGIQLTIEAGYLSHYTPPAEVIERHPVTKAMVWVAYPLYVTTNILICGLAMTFHILVVPKIVEYQAYKARTAAAAVEAAKVAKERIA